MRRDWSIRSGGCGSAGMLVWLVASVVLVGARLGLAQAINDPRRGIHMSNCTFTSGHRTALMAMNPKMVLVSSLWLDANMASYLRNDLGAGAEIFVRRYPTTCASGFDNPAYDVAYMSPSDLAYDIVSKYWYYHDTYQLDVTRWIPGNEPDNEWAGDKWDANKWAAIGTYYSQVWDQVEYWKTHYPGKPAAPIELYTPAFAGFADVGVGNYWADPNNHPYPEDGQYVRRYGLGHNAGHNWMYNPDSNSYPIGLNVAQVRSMIEKYQRFTWHNYWQPGIAWEHRVHQWFPQWLRERLYGPVAYYPSRITEAGWIIDALQQWPDWDAWVTPPVAWAGYYETDIKYFLDNCCGAGGVAIWLLDDGGEFLPMAALDANDNPRPWFNGLIRLLNGLTPSRLATITRSPATLAPSCLQGSNAASQSFTIRNSGWGTLSYSITDDVGWLSVTPTSGTSTGETDTITVNYSTSGLSAGTYNGTITITAPDTTNSPQTIAVTLTVVMPTITISNFNLSFGSTTATFTWTTNVESTSYVYYRVYGTTPWTTVSDTNLVINHSMTITGLSEGVQYEYILKSTRSGYQDGIASGTFMSAPASPTIERSPATLTPSCTQGSNAASQSFTVRNSGGGTLNYSISDNANWISCSPTSGTSTGETDTITVNYSTSSLTPGTYNGTITITAAGATNNPQTIAVTLTVTAPPTIAMMPTTLTPSCTQGSNAASQSFAVWNSGGGALIYSITDNVSWLSCSPTSGMSTGMADPITVNYSTSSLTAGTYSGAITITDPNATNNPQSITVTLTVNPPPPTIERSPAALSPSCNQGSNAASQSFTIRNSGGGTLNYSISDDAAWLSCSPTSGTSTGETDTMTVTYSTSSLAPGTYNGTITITAAGATNNPQTIAVTLTVIGPGIERSPATLTPSCTQGSNAASQSFTVRNSGGGTLNYSISDNANWLSCSPTSGTSTGETDTITVTYSTSSLTPGTYSGTITITAAGAANSPQTIAVTLTVTALPAIVRSPIALSPSCKKGSNAAPQTFTIRNSGGGTLSYSITDNVTWLSCSPTSGTSTGETDTIQVYYTTSQLTCGVYNGTITITAPGASNSPQTIAVRLTVYGPSTGALAGTVRVCILDPNSPTPAYYPLPGAVVTVAGLLGSSDANGFYIIPCVPLGTYQASCNYTGYGTLYGNVTISNGQTTTKDWTFTIER